MRLNRFRLYSDFLGTIEKCKYDIEIEFPDGALAIAPSNIPALVLDLHNMQVSWLFFCASLFNELEARRAKERSERPISFFACVSRSLAV